MGPVFPYENGNAYRNLPAIQSAHCYYKSSKDKPQAKQIPNCGMAAKLATDVHVSINADNNPFYTTRASATRDDRVHERAVVDANKATYGGIGVAAATAANANAAAHRKVGSVQYGMARMYWAIVWGDDTPLSILSSFDGARRVQLGTFHGVFMLDLSLEREREKERNNNRVAGFTASPYFVGENSGQCYLFDYSCCWKFYFLKGGEILLLFFFSSLNIKHLYNW